MKALVTPALAGFAALLVGGCATTDPTPSSAPAATARIEEWSAAYYGSATSGKGVLHFNGKNYRFSISGVGAGGTGGQKVVATAKIYNLNRIEDFPGTYRSVSQGFTVIEGTMHAKLTSQNGVVIYVSGETTGLASSSGVQEFIVTLTK